MSERLTRFRAYMAALNPTDASSAVASGHYVPTPGRVPAERLAARLQLQPAASMALVGGIGSGKSTQLLVLRDKLAQAGDMCAISIDVAEKQDLSRMTSSVLVLLAGLAIGERLQLSGHPGHDLQPALQRLHNVADGQWFEDVYDDDGGSEYMRFSPGLLIPPRHAPDISTGSVSADVAALAARLREMQPNVILLVDSLDRLSDLDTFSLLIEQDVRTLSSLGLGVVLAAPLRSLFGTWRATLDHLGSFELLPPFDVELERDRRFLCDVLRARVPVDGMTDAVADELAQLSGGVLRDLLMLARLATEEAYLSGAERIEPQHVRAAADAFGRKHLFGVTPAQLATLERLRSSHAFVPTTDDDLALLMTRRVLEYQRAQVEYALHPTLVPLLHQLAHAA